MRTRAAALARQFIREHPLVVDASFATVLTCFTVVWGATYLPPGKRPFDAVALVLTGLANLYYIRSFVGRGSPRLR